MSSEIVMQLVMSQFGQNEGAIKIFGCSDFKVIFDDIVKVANEESHSNSLRLLSTILPLTTYDYALDDFRAVRVRLQDIITVEEAVAYWEALEKVAHKLMNCDQSNWIKSPEDAFFFALIVKCARKSMKYWTVNLITHKNCLVTTHDKYKYIKEKYYAIISMFDAMVLKLLHMYTACEFIDTSRILKCPNEYLSLATTVNTLIIREMQVDELAGASYCERFRKKLDPVSSVGTLVLTAPDLNSCSLCHKVFLCIGSAELPFVIVSSCNHLFCMTCIQEYFPEKADTICSINDCNHWNRFWITRNTLEAYISYRSKKHVHFSSALTQE